MVVMPDVVSGICFTFHPSLVFFLIFISLWIEDDKFKNIKVGTLEIPRRFIPPFEIE